MRYEDHQALFSEPVLIQTVGHDPCMSTLVFVYAHVLVPWRAAHAARRISDPETHLPATSLSPLCHRSCSRLEAQSSGESETVGGIDMHAMVN